ncbi:hypothetical protein [Paludisphaera soli]|uniref:hypothetical protein n=1 Tax=Paludisphaera soli TaxID=2712865 RepID=UPI0013EAA1CB|nr:hypothetical protein [Paludisphaera soli]
MGLVERDSGPRGGWRRFRLSLRATAAALAMIAIALGLYVRAVERRLGRVPVGIKNFIAVDVRVLDEAGRPIPDAEVFRAHVLPDGLDGLETLGGDLRPPSSRTRDDGWVRVYTQGDYQRLPRRGAFGLLPVAGDPEVVFHPRDGFRIRAVGCEPRTMRLEDLRREAGVRLPLGGVLPPVAVRLKKAGNPGAGEVADR